MSPNQDGYTVEDARRYNKIRQHLSEADYIKVHRMLDIWLLEHAYDGDATKITYYKDDDSITFDTETFSVTRIPIKRRKRVKHKALTPITDSEIKDLDSALDDWDKRFRRR